ncbi:Short-chain dehydrogenase/reductase SDR [Trinorchestia longiramus]|nr:Short-chain dehydrogenase/reductase SDR [Trinorchestia longiramus]
MSTPATAPSKTTFLENTTSAVADMASMALTVMTVLGALVVSIIYTVFAALKTLVPRRYRRHDITGKVALVTGGGSGIGRLVCMRLAKKGAKVVTWDVNETGNAETVRLVKEAGYECQASTVDLCDRHAIYKAAEQLSKQGTKVDILVNNAGIVTGRNFLESPDEHVERTFAVNVLSHFWTAKAFLPAMLDSNSGHVVTVASVAGKIGVNKLIDYCSSKFAAVGFDESLRAELMVGFLLFNIRQLC